MTLTIAALLFLIGYASQRSGVCMVRAVREVVERRRIHRIAGFALAAASATLVMAAAELAGARPFATILGAAPDALALAGGVIFGLGALISGHCAIGTLAALTAGELWRLGAIAAMFVAALLLGPNMSNAALMLPERSATISPLADRPALAIGVGVVLAALAATYIYRSLGWKKPRSGWSPLVAMPLIGAASGALFALDLHWVYTSQLTALAQGALPLTLATFFTPMPLIIGMLIAARIGGLQHWRLGTLSDWGLAIAGGLLMGLGATLVPGGNDTMLFTGVPLLLPNLLAAYAAFFVTLVLGLYLRPGRQRVMPIYE